MAIDKKIIAVEWRSGLDTVGVVAVKNEHNNKWRAYIGVARGHSEDGDIKHIADWGAKLSKVEALAFFPYLPESDFDEEGMESED